jgi:hypothetical protein
MRRDILTEVFFNRFNILEIKENVNGNVESMAWSFKRKNAEALMPDRNTGIQAIVFGLHDDLRLQAS